MNKKLAKSWADALRSGDYKQGEGNLKLLYNKYNDGEPISQETQHCCLGVLCEIAGGGEWRVRDDKYVYIKNGIENEGALSDEFLDEVGLTSEQQNVLVDMNDGGKSFKEIADYIEMVIAQSELTFSKYQEESSETAKYPGSYTVICPDEHVHSNEALLYLTNGLAAETGELVGKIAKIVRDKGGIFTKEDIEAVGFEAGDILWFVAQICRMLQLDMGKVAEQNREKLISRLARNAIGGSGDTR